MTGCRPMFLAVGFLSAALLSPAAVQAQGRGGMGGGGGMAGPGLVSNPAVAKELKLTEEQTEKAKGFTEEFRAKGTEMMSELEGMEGAERTMKHNAAGMKEVAAMLKPDQEKRFKQIVFQARGVDVLSDPEIAKSLKVTSEQKDKVKNLLEAQQSEMREARTSAGSDRNVMMEKTNAIRKETTAKAMALMSPEQMTMYKEMAGEPFTVPPMGRPAR